MYSTLVSVALFSALAIQGALAEFTVNTPEIVQCEPVKLSWDSTGAKSYNVIIVPNDDPCNGVLADLGDHTVNHITWTPDLKEGAVVMVSVLDSNEDEGWSGAVIVKQGNDTSCLPGAASSAASASAASATAKSSASASSAVSGTTLVVNPAAGPSVTTAPSAPSSPGATAVGAANQGVLGDDNGALASAKLSVSAILLTLGAVAVML
ncbi:hypothetical protein BC628DRAFT_1308047 [Trametes gibbosa]|nr:hypothetical protein BC628DRAFT_1308047 [Trametes gibbosa]